MALAAIIAMLFLPFVLQYLSGSSSNSQLLKTIQSVQGNFYRFFLVVWVLVLGGCFGSFLNVVAWRVPNGRGILGSSKCPFCNTKLSFFSNLPFYGWLSSAGRCRTCKLPISIRYLIAELVLGLIFLLIATVGMGCGGWYLPTRPVDKEWGILNFVLVPKLDLLLIVIYHLIVLCHLYLFALVRVQRLVIPRSIIASALIGVVGFQILWPYVQEAHWRLDLEANSDWGAHFWTTLIMGAATGAFCGWLVWISHSRRAEPHGNVWSECFFGMLVIGLAFGFQFALSVLLAVLIFDSMLILTGNTGHLFQVTPITKIGVFCLTCLVSWRVTSYFPFWPGPFSDSTSLVLAIGVAIVLANFMTFFSVPDRLES